MKRSLLLGVLVACHGGGPASTGSASGSGPTCAAKLDEVARFYDAVADDNAQPAPPAAVRQAAAEAGVETLPEATGAPADLTKADVVLVGRLAVVRVDASGDVRRSVDTPDLGAPDASRTLVMEIDAGVPWHRVEEVRQALAKTGTPYRSIGVAYRTKGARADRAIPKVPGAEPDHVDIPTIIDGIARTAAVHCPDYARQAATLQSHGLSSDPELLHALGRTIPHCDCGVDTAQLEVLPWLVAKPVITVVPFATTAPDLHGAETATWGDLVRDAKGPVPMTLPPPPPPPPPPPHRR